MAAVIRQLITKTIKPSICSRTFPTNRINTFKPSLLLPPTKFLSTVPTPYEIVDSKEDNLAAKGIFKLLLKSSAYWFLLEIFSKVQELVKNNKQGRLFAVVHLAGKQRKVTEGDVLIVEGYWPPTIGDRISLDKARRKLHLTNTVNRNLTKF